MESGQDIGRQCVMFNVRKTARALTRRYEAALKPLDLKAGQFSIMAALLDHDGLPLGALAERLGMDRTTLNRNLRPLEQRGVVESLPNPEDRRTRLLRLTDAGREAMARAIPLWRQAQADALDRLGPDNWETFKAELDAVG